MAQDHVMVDIETLGNKVDSVILSLSAVQFDITTGETTNEFEVHINIDSCILQGRNINQSTLLWWLEQDKEAIDRALGKHVIRTHLIDAISLFYT